MYILYIFIGLSTLTLFAWRIPYQSGLSASLCFSRSWKICRFLLDEEVVLEHCPEMTPFWFNSLIPCSCVDLFYHSPFFFSQINLFGVNDFCKVFLCTQGSFFTRLQINRSQTMCLRYNIYTSSNRHKDQEREKAKALKSSPTVTNAHVLQELKKGNNIQLDHAHKTKWRSELWLDAKGSQIMLLRLV